MLDKFGMQQEKKKEAEQEGEAAQETGQQEERQQNRGWSCDRETVAKEGNLWRKRQENVSGWIMREQKDPGIREKIILEYAPLVKVVAGRLHMYLGSNVEYEELVSYGIFGLIDAIDKFDSLKDVKFETYASLRIRGAILDQIRRWTGFPARYGKNRNRSKV